MRNLFQFVTIFVAFALLAGCNNNVGLKGKVTFKDDGSPLTIGTVAFLKDGHIARATLDDQGNYVVGFEEEANGLPSGRWTVYITGALEILEKDERGATIRSAPLIDAKYESPETSGLVLDVDASTREFNIEVERAVKR